ncbi:MAG: SAM-dependent methyltransferase [Prevotella sp.]|nr:SAM-dependent methyltransferase [Prevotella sp.]MBO5205558.1 SAM-dependent methyltransferase [Prevotella sp.]
MTSDKTELYRQCFVPDKATAEFIATYRNYDVRMLAFKRADGVDMPLALEQIAGYQKARRKLPQWSGVEGMLFPPSLSMEQCSSEQTALYKVSLLASCSARSAGGSCHPAACSGSFADLTGGFGVDFSYLAARFAKATYIERNPKLCAIARHNFALLGLTHAEVVCGDSVECLRNLAPVDVIYLDPARRDANGGRTFAIADCTPDAVALLPLLLEKAETVMIKLSPMIDWHKAVTDFCGHVAEVHIVAVDNECKELLLILRRDTTECPKVVCVNNGCVFSPTPYIYIIRCSAPSVDFSQLHGFLLVPNAAIMKAGCFAQVAEAFSVAQISDNSHLFVADAPVEGFPGSTYRIDTVTTMNKKELKATIGGIKKANIAVRNFPLTVAELRKRLKINDGGNIFIFATTLCDGSHVLIVCSPL